MSKFTHVLLPSKKVVGLEIFQQDDDFRYHLVILEKKKEKIQVIEQFFYLEDLKSVKTHAKELPIYITINTKTVLHKIVPTAQPSIEDVLPNANAKDFFFQSIPALQGSIASIVRISVLKELIATFEKEQLWVLDIRLGSFEISYLLDFIHPVPLISTTVHHLHIQNEQIQQFTNLTNKEDVQQQVLLGDKWTDSRALVAIAVGFRGFANNIPVINLPEILSPIQKEFYHKRLFELGGVSFLVVLLLVLLVNFGLFTSYSSTNQQLQAQVNVQRGILNKLDTLQAQYEKQSQFFDQSNLAQSSKLSFYADDLARNLPQAISFTKLAIAPKVVRKRLEVEEALPEFQTNTIHLMGKTTSSFVFNSWKKDLQQKEWIESITLQQYQEEQSVGTWRLEIVFVGSGKSAQ